MLTIEEVARRLGVKPKTIANRIYAGEIPAVKPLFGRACVPPLIVEAICGGLQPAELAHVARLCQQFTDAEERAREVRAYIARQPVAVPRGRRTTAGAA